MQRPVIVDAVRTASGRGKPGGALSAVQPAELLACVLRAIRDRNQLDPGLVDDVIAGCVTQSGEQAMNVARIALLTAGFPVEVPGTTIDRQCGSSQQAIHFAAQGVAAGAYDIVVACGVESMSRVPMFSSVNGAHPTAPLDRRFGPLPTQGVSAELIAARWGIDRCEMDEYAAESHRRAAVATRGTGPDIVPVGLPDGTVHVVDETLRPDSSAEQLAQLRPAFHSEETAARYPEIRWGVTAGNSSPLSDGASATLIMSESKAADLGLTPRARFVGFAVTGSDPELMLTGPIPATHQVLTRARLRLDQIDAFEVNEAFASVPLAWTRELGADPELVNPRGGAIALGHPLGASGARLMTSLLHQLEQTGADYGLQTMCEGGGMANATIIERLG